MDIPILIIYYLLSYAWDKLDEAEPKEVSQVDNHNVINLFARVLSNRTAYLLRRGLDRGYIEKQDILGVVKGKINISETYLKNLLPMAKVDCTFDELSYNVIHNRILKSTLESLLKSDELRKDVREQLRLSYLKLPADIEMLNVRKEHFRSLKFHRNNFFYDFLMKICELINDNYLTDETDGKKVFQDFTRERKQMQYLFESFVAKFYQKHRDEHAYRVSSQKRVDWYNLSTDEESNQYLPTMQPDIVLESQNRKIVLDTKYYKDALKEYHGKKRISSDNLYQMYAYMKNLAANDSSYEYCDGILLYPTVDESFKGAMWELDGHKLYAKMINLNQDWDKIHSDLLNVINE